jgi:hypothetical protein
MDYRLCSNYCRADHSCALFLPAVKEDLFTEFFAKQKWEVDSGADRQL